MEFSELLTIHAHRFIQALDLPLIEYPETGVDIDGLYIKLEQSGVGDDILENADPFIIDVIRQRGFLNTGNFSETIALQVKWQNKIDKFLPDTLQNLYLGQFFLNQGYCYTAMSEFEVAANQAAKARKYFEAIEYLWGVFEINYLMAEAFTKLGARGDARYHLREILRLSNYQPLIHHVGVLLVESYVKSQIMEKAQVTSDDVLTKLDDEWKISFSKSVDKFGL